MQEKIIYKTDLNKLDELKEKTLVAIVPDEDNPHAVFYIPAINNVRVENKTGAVYLSYYCYSNVREKVEEVIKELSGTDEEEVFCTNPDCMNFGCVVEEPIKEKDGTLICPECGEELSTEEVSTEDLSFDDLKRIVGELYTLVKIALEGSDTTELDLTLEEMDISIEEINWIKEHCL